MRAVFVFVALFFCGPAFGQGIPFAARSSGEFPTETQNLDALAAVLSGMVSGEWRLIPGSDFNDVRLTTDERNAILAANPGDPSFWGQTGSKAVIKSYGSAAFDPINYRMYFSNGGHADYGGNEVYEYDFTTLEWTRLNDPSSLGLVMTGVNDPLATGLSVPSVGPGATHNYNGIVWNPATQTIWMAVPSVFSSALGPPVQPDYLANWQFDPATNQWDAGSPTAEDASRPDFVYLPGTQEMLLFWRRGSALAAAFYATDGTETLANGGANIQGSWSFPSRTLRIPDNASPGLAGRLFLIGQTAIQEISISGSTITEVGAEGSLPETTLNEGQLGYAWSPIDEKFYVWLGGRETATWDPSDGTWTDFANAASATAPTYFADGYIHGKWVYIEEVDTFFGLSHDEQGGIWAFKR